MVEYKELTETQETMMIGRTYCMWKDGMSNAEIAECLKRPIEEVNEWVEMCKFGDSKITQEEYKFVHSVVNKERVP